MPSLSARVVSFVLRKTGIYRRQFSGGPDFSKYQSKALAVPSAPSAKASRKARISRSAFKGRPVWEIAPLEGVPTVTVLYWHGGGYVYPPAAAHWDFLVHMAATQQWRIIAPLYRLAPAAEVGEVSNFALDVWRDVSARDDLGSIIMAGDSAGGGLAAATAMLARDAGLPLPQKLILICPWLDADPSHPDQVEIEKRDAILTLRGIREAGAFYAGAAGALDTRVSPIYGDWSGLPPILAFGGGDDILVTDARRLKEKLPSVDYREEAGMIHDWPIFTFPESRRAQAEMGAYSRS